MNQFGLYKIFDCFVVCANPHCQVHCEDDSQVHGVCVGDMS